jgi:hypothetical protein
LSTEIAMPNQPPSPSPTAAAPKTLLAMAGAIGAAPRLGEATAVVIDVAALRD